MWAHLDHYAYAYPNERMMVSAVAANLEGEAAEGITSFHDEDIPELGNIDLFLEELRSRFEDESQACKPK